MNIADLVTQVSEDPGQRQVTNSHNSIQIDASPPTPPAEDETAEQPGFLTRLFCCLVCKSAPVAAGNRKGGTPSRGPNNTQSSVPLQNQAGGAGGVIPGTQRPLLAPNGHEGGLVPLNGMSGSGLPSHSNNIVTPPPAKYLLAPVLPEDIGKKVLVLDLDETLVHSSFKPIPNADFVISIELESVIHRVYVRKRPGVDAFMDRVGERFEVVVFTASLSKYADPLLDILDKKRVVRARLFREACVCHFGNYVKDLSHLGRRMEDIVIVDNSPFSYMFQPDNAIAITSWFNDKNDRQLYELLPYLEALMQVDDVSHVLSRRKPAYGSGIGVPPHLLPPGFTPTVQLPDDQQRRGM